MYRAKVNASFDFTIDPEDIDQLDTIETSKNSHHILKDNASVSAEVLQSNFFKKTYSVKVKNNVYQVEIHDKLDQQIESLGFELGASKQVNAINAPMPGLILEVNVEEGQEVKEGDALLILEAMKMENVINSPRDAIVKSLNVAKGDAVEKNSLLIEFE